MKPRKFGTADNETVEILFTPVSQTTAAIVSKVYNLRDWDHVSFLLQLGAVHDSSNGDITIVGSSANDGTTDAAVLATINYRVKLSAAQWGAWAQVTDSKLDWVSGGEVDITDDQIVQIDVDASDIKALSTSVDLDWACLKISATGQTNLIGGLAVLSGGRYGQTPPALAV
jgi:hypothetical protein